MLPYWRTLGLAGIVLATGIAVYVLITVLVNDRRTAKRAEKP